MYLERDKESDSLNAVVSSVHIVSHEQIVCVGRFAANAKELNQIMKLSMDIAAYGYRASDALHV